LLAKKFEALAKTFRDTFGQKQHEIDRSMESAKDQFKRRFEQLSDGEIASKLEQDLVPEAIAALNEIKNERSSYNKIFTIWSIIRNRK